jgi:hypothetical protein
MLRFITRILLLLLIVTVPLQGATAAAMMAREVLGSHSASHVMSWSHDDGAPSAIASGDGDDHCLAHASDGLTKPTDKSIKHAGHACRGCVACSLCSVIPLSFPLLIHLDDLVAQAVAGPSVEFISHIPEALQRPPVFRV